MCALCSWGGRRVGRCTILQGIRNPVKVRIRKGGPDGANTQWAETGGPPWSPAPAWLLSAICTCRRVNKNRKKKTKTIASIVFSPAQEKVHIRWLDCNRCTLYYLPTGRVDKSHARLSAVRLYHRALPKAPTRPHRFGTHSFPLPPSPKAPQPDQRDRTRKAVGVGGREGGLAQPVSQDLA